MFEYPALFFLAVLAAAVWADRVFFQKTKTERSRLRSLVVMGLVVAAYYVVYKLSHCIFDDQNWIRLQTSIALGHGFNPYSGINHGAVLTSMYGPISVLAYLPSMWGRTPELTMIIAECIAISLYFFPVVFITSIAVRESRITATTGLGLFLVFFFVTGLSSPLRAAAFDVHADAPSLGLGALACIAILRRESFLWAALFAVLSVGSKQVAAPILLALTFFAFRLYGKRLGLKLTQAVIFAGAGLAVFFAWIFGFENLYFNMFTIPSSQPWQEGGWLPSAAKLLREILILSPFFFIARLSRGGDSEPRRRISAERLFYVTALFMVPISIIGKSKLGGSNNTLSYCLYYLVIGLVFTLLTSNAKPRGASNGISVILAALLLIHIPGVFIRINQPHEPNNYARTAYDYARMHPGIAYFPRLSLITLLAEQKQYHDSSALRDRQWAGHRLTRDHYLEHIPPQMELIAFRQGANQETDILQSWDYNKRDTDYPELPGFIVYTKPNPS